jgi:inositol hexakisphosphate/diphosphoinositol-pentakisphosphate kinase
VPRHIIVSRDLGPGGEPGPDPEGFEEGDDWVELNGVRIEKPFVEKPVSGEDHNIWIFYPSHMVSRGVV